MIAYLHGLGRSTARSIAVCFTAAVLCSNLAFGQYNNSPPSYSGGGGPTGPAGQQITGNSAIQVVAPANFTLACPMGTMGIPVPQIGSMPTGPGASSPTQIMLYTIMMQVSCSYSYGGSPPGTCPSCQNDLIASRPSRPFDASCASGSCGRGPMVDVYTNSISPAMQTCSMNRRWIPNNRLFNSSFSPGHYGTWDTQLQIYPTGDGSMGGTFKFLDVETGGVFSLIEGVTGTPDGIYTDFQNASVKAGRLLNSSGSVTVSLQNATQFEIEHKSGLKDLYELIDLDPVSTQKQLAGRWIRRTDLDGRTMVVTYKTWTQSELTASPDRQWQVNTITDVHGDMQTFTYAASQVGGRWVVSRIDSSTGVFATYQYASGSLVSVTHPDGLQTTFTYGQDPIAQTATAIVKDIKVEGGAPLTYHLTNDYMTLSPNGQAQVVNQPLGLFRLKVDNTSYTRWMRVAPADPSLDQGMIYVGGNQALTRYGNKTYRKFDNWAPSNNTGTTDPNQPYPGVTFTSNPQTYGVQYTDTYSNYREKYSGATDENGRVATFQYTNPNGSLSKKTFTADGTFEDTAANAFDQLTRKRDRSGEVVINEYDTNGHLLKRKTGLIDQAGTDVATAEYAESTYEYYQSTHINKGLLKSAMGPLYSVASPTMHRTDYEYNAQQRLTKVTGPSDTAGSARPVTLYAYDAAGRVSSTTDPLGRVTSYTYDPIGRLVSTTYPDNTNDQTLYGAAGTPDAGRIVKTKNRVNVVTTRNYDSAGRLVSQAVGAAIDANILDGQPDTQIVTDPNLLNISEYAYLPGSESITTQVKTNGAKTDYYYDYLNRMIESRQYPNASIMLASKKAYANNELFYDEDPYGRRKYYGYRASDGTLIRTITCTVPEQTFASFTAVWNQTRNTAANAKFIIHDAIRDADGHLTQVIDGRGTETRYEYDSQGREINKREAFGTAIEARTQTIYDVAGNVIEVRSPRYFDATDANGLNKAKDTFTYNGRGMRATHTEAQGTPEAATESFTYDLLGKQLTRTDFGGNVWTTIDNACCGKQTGSQDPLGHGSIRNSDSLGRSIHSITVSDISTHTDFSNPLDAKTLGESTTKYDALGRVVASTTWLTPRGVVDPANPPIAGLGSVAASQGLTTFYLYDTNLSDGVGLDSATGLSVTKQSGANPTGTFSVSLTNAISKLTETQTNGGAGVTFNASSPAKATVTVNSEDEISFNISDAAGRSVMSGKLDNYKGTQNALVSWSTQVHDGTYNLAGYGTLSESKSIDALGFASRQRSDAAGRTLQSLNQLDAVTAFTYDAGGNQLSVRDPNNVGADMIYDARGRNTSKTDTVNDVTSTTFDLAGNAIKQTDAKGKFTTIAFDARGRRKSTTDRLGGVTAFSYTALGQLSSLTDAENQSTVYSYDARGAKLTEQYPDHTSGSTPGQLGYGIVTFVYDNAGRTLRKQDQQGDTVTYNYDFASRMTSRDYRILANSPSGAIADSDVFTFDRSGRMLTAYSGRYGNTVTYTFDSVGRKATEALTIAAQAYTTGMNYNARGELIKYTYPDGSIVERLYHPTGNLNQVKLDGTALDTRTFDNGGRLSTSTYSNGIVTTWGYRNDNLVSSINTTSPAGTPADQLVGNLAYTWDANKNKLSETISNVPVAVAGYGFNAVDTTYDFEDRLTQWKRSSGSQNQSWNLTLVGDWTSQTVNGTTTGRTHGPTHELLAIGSSSLSYDAKGNLTQDTSRSTTQNYTWDFDNKMKSADIDGNGMSDVTFEYDAFGRRVSRTQGSDAVVFYQVDQQTVADYPRGGTAASPTYRYFWASYIDELIARKGTGTGGSIIFAHHNQQFSIYSMTNTAGAAIERIGYTAYGQPSLMNAVGTVQSTSPNASRYSFTGREWDSALQFYHFRARWMSGVSGRFPTRDPIGYGDSNNPFQFIHSNPLLTNDPLGYGCRVCFDIVGFAYELRDDNNKLAGCVYKYKNTEDLVKQTPIPYNKSCPQECDDMNCDDPIIKNMVSDGWLEARPPSCTGQGINRRCWCPPSEKVEQSFCRGFAGKNCKNKLDFETCMKNCDTPEVAKKVCERIKNDPPKKLLCKLLIESGVDTCKSFCTVYPLDGRDVNAD